MPAKKASTASTGTSKKATSTKTPTSRKKPAAKTPKTGGEEAGATEDPKPQKVTRKSAEKVATEDPKPQKVTRKSAEKVATEDPKPQKGTRKSTEKVATEDPKPQKGTTKSTEKVATPTGKASSRREKAKPSISEETGASVAEDSRPRRTTRTKKETIVSAETESSEEVDPKPKTKPKGKGVKDSAAPVQPKSTSDTDGEEAGTSEAEDPKPKKTKTEEKEAKKTSTSRRKPATSNKKTAKSTNTPKKQQDPYKMKVDQDYLVLTKPLPKKRGESNRGWNARMARISLRNQYGKVIPFSQGGGYCVAMNKGPLDTMPRQFQEGAEEPPKRAKREPPKMRPPSVPTGIGLRTRSGGTSVTSKSTGLGLEVKATKRKAEKALAPVIEEGEEETAEDPPAKRRKANPVPAAKTLGKVKTTKKKDPPKPKEKAKEATKKVLPSKIRDDKSDTESEDITKSKSKITGGKGEGHRGHDVVADDDDDDDESPPPGARA